MMRITLLVGLAFVFAACNGDKPHGPLPDTSGSAARPAAPVAPEYTYRIVHQYPHDTSAFTQGLLVHNNRFIESTGRNGFSSLREVEIESGKVIRRFDVPAEYFAEGLALHDGKLYQLTWQNFMGFVYDLSSFRQIDTFRYYGAGWGMTSDSASLIMSDGTDELRFMKPTDETLERTLAVRATDGTKVKNLNELEWVEGEIWANIYQTDLIARINPKTGVVDGWINLSGILPREIMTGNEDVLNGIAYDPPTKRLFVTGKLWPAVFEIEIVPKKAAS